MRGRLLILLLAGLVWPVAASAHRSTRPPFSEARARTAITGYWAHDGTTGTIGRCHTRRDRWYCHGIEDRVFALARNYRSGEYIDRAPEHLSVSLTGGSVCVTTVEYVGTFCEPLAPSAATEWQTP